MQVTDDAVKQRLREEDDDFVDLKHVPAAEALLKKVMYALLALGAGREGGVGIGVMSLALLPRVCACV